MQEEPLDTISSKYSARLKIKENRIWQEKRETLSRNIQSSGGQEHIPSFS